MRSFAENSREAEVCGVSKLWWQIDRGTVLATVADQPDIEVVGVLEDEAAIAETAERAHPDFLIIGLDRFEERPKICGVLLDRFPRQHLQACPLEP